MRVLVARARATTTDENNIEVVKKMILDNHLIESLLERFLTMLADCSGHAKQFLLMF